MTRGPSVALGALMLVLCSSAADAGQRLDHIRQRGFLICGVSPGVAGFSEVDDHGRHTGFDVDICRAVSAAIFGTADHVTYVEAPSIQEFLRSPDVDIVSRRLTWSLTREGFGVLFGPIVFYDGQGFLVAKKLQVKTVRELSGVTVCVDPGTAYEYNLSQYFRSHKLELKKVILKSRDELVAAFDAGRCGAYTADVSELGSLRSKMPKAGDLDILGEDISKEPLAPLVRQDDLLFFSVLRWTVFAMIAAEELGITATNVDGMLGTDDPDRKRLLGVIPGNGKALGLDERWAYHVIKAVGNYGEMFDRNVGSRSGIKLERGLNSLWTAGGLIYAPQLR
jgi:general L-amino acid transport system substrate-binding protein